MRTLRKIRAVKRANKCETCGGWPLVSKCCRAETERYNANNGQRYQDWCDECGKLTQLIPCPDYGGSGIEPEE